MPKFKFELKQPVTIGVSGEQGSVVSRMEHIDSKNQYQVRYKSADGRALESWFFESELKATPAAKKAAKRPTAKKSVAKKRAARSKKLTMPTVR